MSVIFRGVIYVEIAVQVDFHLWHSDEEVNIDHKIYCHEKNIFSLCVSGFVHALAFMWRGKMVHRIHTFRYSALSASTPPGRWVFMDRR
jgi:hypothetical protein